MSPSRKPVRDGAVAIAVGVALVLLGRLLVLERQPDADMELLRIRADALHYLGMVRGEDAPPPFRYRVGAPWLVSVLPVSPYAGFRFAAWVAMAVTYAISYALARRAGIRRSSAALGVLLVWAAPWSLYVFHNPFLTDALAHAFVAGEIALLSVGWVSGFVLLVLVGMAVRESTSVLAPMLVAVGRRRAAVALTVIVVAWFVGVRAMDGGEGRLIEALRSRLDVQGAIGVVRDGYLAWGGLWLIAPAGLRLLPVAQRHRVRLAALCLLAGALAASLVAADVGRMFAFLLAPFGIAAAAVVEQLRREGRAAVVGALTVAALLGAVAWMPNRVLPPGGELFQASALRWAAALLSAGTAYVAAVRCRREVMED